MVTQKHYMKISRLVEEDTEFNERNTRGFQKGDIIQITEKYDGSNACVCWDADAEDVICFSRKRTLSEELPLNGFYHFVKNFSEETKQVFKNNPNYRVFGEWNNKVKIIYSDTPNKHWYVFDIYDTETEKWLHQDKVHEFCKEAGLEEIHEVYYGEFKDWEHCKSFLRHPHYGDTQEGVVVKNMSKLNVEDKYSPFYIKIVDKQFLESKRVKEVKKKNKDENFEFAKVIAESVVTKNRVEKNMLKLINEGELPSTITAKEMGKVVRLLPKVVYEDCLAEEKQSVDACGEYFPKLCSSITVHYAKHFILGVD